MTTIWTIVNILSLVSNADTQELVLISQLNNFFKFDHNIFLLDSSIDINRFIRIRCDGEFTPQSLLFFNKKDNFTKLQSVKNITSKNTFLIVAPECDVFEGNLNLLSRVKRIQQTQIEMKIGVFFLDIDSKANVQKLFEWCWNNRIINIFVATYFNHKGSTSDKLLNVFTFNPFGTFRIINVTGSQAFDNFFLSQKSNFQQHRFRMGEGPTDKTSLKLWDTVFRVMNASFLFDDTSTQTNIPWDSRNDLRPALYFPNPRNGRKINMYPMRMDPRVLLVPEALPYSEFASYLQTVTADPYFGYYLIIIAGVILLLNIFRFIKHKKILFFESSVDVLNLLMNDNTYIKYQILSRMELFLIVPLTFVGFVIVNGVFSNLQSYLTRPFLQTQMNTIEEIYESELQIYSYQEPYKKILIIALNSLAPHADWNDKIHIMNRSILDERRKTYDTSVIYVTHLDDANRLIAVQKKLNIKGYHQILTISTSIATYIVHLECPFTERFNEIIHRTRTSGLFDLWIRQDNIEEDKRIFEQNLRNAKIGEDSIKRFPIPMIIIHGWITGMIVFLIEIIWDYFMKMFYKQIVKKFRKSNRIFVKKMREKSPSRKKIMFVSRK